jgi:hypothetical protein
MMTMRVKLPPALALVAVLLAYMACSENPSSKAKEAGKESTPEPITGQSAFYRMYGVARTWAPDVEALQLRSLSLTAVKSVPGKAGAWEATFMSPSLRQSRVYTYSTVKAAGNLRKGVFAGPLDSYDGDGQSQPFPASAVRIDSDKAYELALEHAADYAKENPNLPISFLLEWNRRQRFPAWRVMWGESAAVSGLSIFIDSGAGTYLQTMH